MSDDKQQPDAEGKSQPSESPLADNTMAGMAQVGNLKVPRPSKVSDRSVPDDIDE
jgi:hypothetical protein